MWYLQSFFFFFFNDTATTEIYTLSLHDALPISNWSVASLRGRASAARTFVACWGSSTSSGRSLSWIDRKSTRLNSSHLVISYAVFCLKKKKNINIHDPDNKLQPRVRRRHALPLL